MKTITAWITVVRSIGMPVTACMLRPPEMSAANSNEPRTMPPGLFRPKSATVIALKPVLPP